MGALQTAFEAADGYELEARAQTILRGMGFRERRLRAAHRRAVRGLAHAGGAGPAAARAARPAAARRAHQPPGPGEPAVARGVPAGVEGRAGDHQPRPLLPQPYGHPHRGARSGRARPLRRRLRPLRGARSASATRRCPTPPRTSSARSSRPRASSAASAPRTRKPSRCSRRSSSWSGSTASTLPTLERKAHHLPLPPTGAHRAGWSPS